MPLGAASQFRCARTHGKARIQHTPPSGWCDSRAPLLVLLDASPSAKVPTRGAYVLQYGTLVTPFGILACF
ncbi:MAG: hypothetical protein BJ554DRAFT_6610, partial [Olpidium bornovanus]